MGEFVMTKARQQREAAARKRARIKSMDLDAHDDASPEEIQSMRSAVRDEDGFRHCEKCDEPLADDPWEARVCFNCKGKTQTKAIAKWQKNHPAAMAAATARWRKKQKQEKVAALLKKLPPEMSGDELLMLLCNRCLRTIAESTNKKQSNRKRTH